MNRPKFFIPVTPLEKNFIFLNNYDLEYKAIWSGFSEYFSKRLNDATYPLLSTSQSYIVGVYMLKRRALEFIDFILNRINNFKLSIGTDGRAFSTWLELSGRGNRYSMLL